MFGNLNSIFSVQKIWNGIAYIDCGVNAKNRRLSIVSENWIHFFKSGNLNSYFWFGESELIISSPENLKWDCVYWLWRECKKNVCWVLFRKTELLFLSPETTGQKTFAKVAPKNVQNTFGHFWNRLRAIFENWTFFDFSETFRRLDPPWNTGHFFSKKLPQNMFKTSLDIFGNDLGHFCNFEFFFEFFENFRWIHGTMIKKNFSKNIAPRHVWTIGNDFGHFWNFEQFLILFMNYF